MKDYRFELKYTDYNVLDVDYYIEQARVERANYIASLFRKLFSVKKAEKNTKKSSAYLQQSLAH